MSYDEGLLRLKDGGVLKEHATGGYIIETNPKTLEFSFPISLKDKHINTWSKENKIWLNT